MKIQLNNNSCTLESRAVKLNKKKSSGKGDFINWFDLGIKAGPVGQNSAKDQDNYQAIFKFSWCE